MRIAAFLWAVIGLIAVGPCGAMGQGTPKLVAKPYPGAVPEIWSAKSSVCGDNTDAHCFLTRDPVEKVRAFYREQGMRLEPQPVVGGDLVNFQQALRLQLESYPLGTIDAAPLEFYQTTGADDVPSYFRGVVVMTRKPGRKLGSDAKANLDLLLEDPVFEHLTVNPQAVAMQKAMGTPAPDMQLEPARLAEHYHRHIILAGAYFAREGDHPVPMARLAKILERRAQAPQAESADASGTASMGELNALLKRKPEQQGQVRSLRMKMTMQKGAKDEAGMKQSQAELDQVLMSDPELADWKRRRDGAPQQRAEGRARGKKESEAAQKAHEADLKDPEKLRADMEEYLSALEKEAYFTRILIHATGGNRMKRDPAVVMKEWNSGAGMGTAKPAAAGAPPAAKPAAASSGKKAAPTAQPEEKQEKARAGDAAKTGKEALDFLKKRF